VRYALSLITSDGMRQVVMPRACLNKITVQLFVLLSCTYQHWFLSLVI